VVLVGLVSSGEGAVWIGSATSCSTGAEGRVVVFHGGGGVLFLLDTLLEGASLRRILVVVVLAVRTKDDLFRFFWRILPSSGVGEPAGLAGVDEIEIWEVYGYIGGGWVCLMRYASCACDIVTCGVGKSGDDAGMKCS
jgi:hypothetical protein